MEKTREALDPEAYLIQKFAELDHNGMVEIMTRAAGLLDLHGKVDVMAATLLLLAEQRAKG